MVRHDNPFVEFHVWEMRGEFGQAGGGNLPQGIQSNLIPDHLTEQALPIPGADRDEVRPGLGVVVSREADRSPMMR